MSNAAAGLVLRDAADVRAALLGAVPGSWALTAADEARIAKLPALQGLGR
jgi:hypothetical protein